MKTIKTYSQLAEYLASEKGIKVNTFYGTNYNEYAVYIPRIYASNYRKAKVRVLKQGDNVKNCLKITFNPDKHDKKLIEYFIQNNVKLIQNQLHGSCQSFLTCNNLLQVLTGIIGRNGQPTEEAKQMLNNSKYLLPC